jgi:hypothetical protein
MGYSILRYFEVGDETDKNAIRKIKTLDQLWALLQKKVDGLPIVSIPVEDGFLRDAWGHSYRLELRATEKETIIRITSAGETGVFNGHQDELFVEVVFDGRKAREKRSWEPE